MGPNSETRRNVTESLILTIANAADREYQNRVWIRGEGPECGDFSEFINIFFDTGEPVLENHKGYGLSDDQYRLLAGFAKELDAFLDFTRGKWPQEFLRTPEWKKVMSMAKEVLQSFGRELLPITRNKEKIMSNFLKNIAYAADEQCQENLWVKHIGTERDTFDKFINRFYYGCDDILEDWACFGLTVKQRNLLRDLSREIDSFYPCFPSKFSASVFLHTPEWKKIVQMAQEVLRAFNYPKPITEG